MINIRMKWLTSAEALAVLGSRRQTLYANVSRGRIRAKPDPKDSRRSLYHAGDVEMLAARQGGRRTVATVAANAIDWGDPVLASSVSTVVDGRLWYRGRDAIELAQAATLEEIAELLWEMTGVSFCSSRFEAASGPTLPLSAAMQVLAKHAASDSPLLGRSRPSLAGEAGGLVGEIAGAMLSDADITKPMHRRIATAWGILNAEDVLRRALVLLAEHELNASTFAVRVTASTGAPAAACLLSGLGTLAGPLHGGAAAQMRALTEMVARDGAVGAVRNWLAQGRQVPAFGHPLYPEGDPRAAALLCAFELVPRHAELTTVIEDLTGEKPNIDFALAAMRDSFGLPDSAPLILFAIARCVGWIAHLMEQATGGALIRPRARYNGPPLGKE
jgi:citrate synthase